MLEDAKRSKKKNRDSRLPVTLNTLKMILKILHLICSSKHETTLFSAAFSFAYFGLCRISEIAVSNAVTRHIISVNDITFAHNFIKVRIPSSRTDQNGIGATLILKMQTEPEICPYLLSRIDIQDRPKFAGPLFCHYDGAPITRYQFTAMLNKSLLRADIDCKAFSSHSFRIGRATDLPIGILKLSSSVGRNPAHSTCQFLKILDN